MANTAVNVDKLVEMVVNVIVDRLVSMASLIDMSVETMVVVSVNSSVVLTVEMLSSERVLVIVLAIVSVDMIVGDRDTLRIVSAGTVVVNRVVMEMKEEMLRKVCVNDNVLTCVDGMAIVDVRVTKEETSIVTRFWSVAAPKEALLVHSAHAVVELQVASLLMPMMPFKPK